MVVLLGEPTMISRNHGAQKVFVDSKELANTCYNTIISVKHGIILFYSVFVNESVLESFHGVDYDALEYGRSDAIYNGFEVVVCMTEDKGTYEVVIHDREDESLGELIRLVIELSELSKAAL